MLTIRIVILQPKSNGSFSFREITHREKHFFFFKAGPPSNDLKILEFKCVAFSCSVVVCGGVRAHARNRMSFYFPRLNAPLWFR